MDFHSQRPDRDPRPTLQVITAYPPQSQTSNYSYPLSGTSPGRESVGSDISSVPSMIEDHGSDISTEDEYQYHHTSRSGGLWNCFWNNTQAHEKDFQTTSTPARPISHHAGSTADSTPERKKSSSRPTLASSRPDSGFAQDNNQWPLTPPYTSHSHQVPRTFNKPLPTSTYSLFPPTPPTADSEHSSSVPPPLRRSSLARPWTSDTLRLSEQTPPPPTRTPVVQMCRKSSLGRKRKLGGEPLAVTVCSPSPRSTTTTTTTTTASLVFRARPSIIPAPSSTSNLSQQMASAAYHHPESSSLYPHAPHLTPTDFRRPPLTNLRRNSRGASFPRPPSSRDHHQQPPTRAHQPQQQKQQQPGLEERPLPPLPLSVQPQQRPQRPSRSSPPSPVVFPVPSTSPLPPLQPPPPPPSTLAPAPPPPVVSVFETDSDDEESDSDSGSDDHNHFGAGGVVESFARRLMRSLLGGGHGHGNHHYRHDGQRQGQNHQRSASDYTPSATTTTTTTTPFYKAIHLRRPRSDGGGAAAQQLDVTEEYEHRYRKSCSIARESGSESSGKQHVLGRRGRLWGRSR